MVDSKASLSPGLLVTNPSIFPTPTSAFYTYSSPPRPLQGNQGRSRTCRNKVPKPRGIHDYFNIMWDPHIRRGNTGAKPLERDEIDTNVKSGGKESAQVKVRKKRFTNSNSSYAKSRSRFPKKCSTPPPLDGRFHNLVQTDLYLEDLSRDVDVMEADVNIQTDLILDESFSYVPEPIKVGVDASTQILPGELLDFDDEIQPLLATLVAKVLEQSLMETMEEEELAALHEQQNRFREKKEQEERELKSLQAQHEKIRTERERLKMHLEAPAVTTNALQDPNNSFQQRSSGGPMYTTSYLLELLPSVLNSLKQEGFLTDNIGDDVLSTFVSNINTKSDLENFTSANNSNSTGDTDNNDNRTTSEGAIKENGMRTPADLKHEDEPWKALESLEEQILQSETMENEK